MQRTAASESDRFRPLRTLMEAAIAEDAFPGAAWGVAHLGRVVALDAAGLQRYDAGSPPIHPDTVYDLASVSKVVGTTAAVMLLHQRGRLALPMPLGDILPGFVVPGERGAGRHRVTLELLLAHASGLPGYAPLFQTHADALSLLRACLQMPLRYPPGTRAEYSDIGFILLGKALEVLTRQPLSAFLMREVFTPLGMHSTRYHPAPTVDPTNPPTELDEHFRRRVIQGEVHDENCWVLGGCAGHAGLFGNAEDLLRFAEAMLKPLRASASGVSSLLFEPETVRLFTRRARIPVVSSRALGWDTPEAPSSSGSSFPPDSFGHLGYTGTSLWIDPVRDLAVVLLTNRTWPTRENKRIQEVRPAFHNLVSELLEKT